MFRSGREFGLARCLSRIPPAGRIGSAVRYPKARSRVGGGWIEALLERRRLMVAAIAVANKLARIVWAMMTTGEFYRLKLAA